jgi:BON domain-containing protein
MARKGFNPNLVAAMLVLVIAVGCASPLNDEQISQDAQKKLGAALAEDAGRIHIQVASGVVVLSGTVSSEAERKSAAQAAGQAAGVKAVLNNLMIAAADPAATTPATTDANATSDPLGASAQSDAASSAEATAVSRPGKSAPVLASQTHPLPVKPSPSKISKTALPHSPKAPAGSPTRGATADTLVAAERPSVIAKNAQPPTYVADPHKLRVLPRQVTVPPSTSVFVLLADSLDSSQNQAGETFRGTVARPVVMDNEVAIPQDADVQGRIIDARKGTRFVGKSDLILELSSLSFGGRTYELQTDQWSKSRGGKKATAIKTGVGAGAGAGIGMIAGGALGSAIGAGAGAGAGAVWSAITGGKAIKLAPETAMEFHLTSPITVAPPDPASLPKRPTPPPDSKPGSKEEKKREKEMRKLAKTNKD